MKRPTARQNFWTYLLDVPETLPHNLGESGESKSFEIVQRYPVVPRKTDE